MSPERRRIIRPKDLDDGKDADQESFSRRVLSKLGFRKSAGERRSTAAAPELVAPPTIEPAVPPAEGRFDEGNRRDAPAPVVEAPPAAARRRVALSPAEPAASHEARTPATAKRPTIKKAAPSEPAVAPAALSDAPGARTRAENKAVFAEIRRLEAAGEIEAAATLARDRGWEKEASAIVMKARLAQVGPRKTPAKKATAKRPIAPAPKAAAIGESGEVSQHRAAVQRKVPKRVIKTSDAVRARYSLPPAAEGED